MNPSFFKSHDLLIKALEIMPIPIAIVDNDVRILYYNQAMLEIAQKDKVINQRAGEVLHCIRSIANGCGRSEFCKQCVIRNSVNESIKGLKVHRKQASIRLISQGQETEAFLLITTAPFEYGQETFVIIAFENISELIQLKSLIPICARCKKIRNDKGYWESIEKYMSERLDVFFSHGLCPDCLKELYPDLYENGAGANPK